MTTRLLLAALCCGLLCASGLTASAAEQRYAAMLADGTRLAGDDVQEWFDPSVQPKLAGRALFDPSVPFRWLIDNSLSIAAVPPAYVEMIGGDRLPGDVLAYQSGSESPYDRQPPCLIVRPGLELNWPDFGPETPVRVQTHWLQRVVWEGRAGNEYRPGTLFLRDGRQIAFRSLRWSEGAVVLLLDGGGIQEHPFGEIAEVHLPRRNPWTAYAEQLAVLSPTVAARLIQLETTEGLRVTTSTERFQARHRGDRNRRENWYQLVQPAWSLDPFWVRFPTVRAWRFFAPHEVPLTLIPPVEVAQDSVFGSGWRWQLDRNVQHEALRSGGEPFGWGFGVQAHNELVFELPPSARAVRARVGLDRLAGDGGCAQGRIALSNNAAAPLFESAILVGAQTVADSGVKPLPSGLDGSVRLVLTADPVHTGRPSGADPFDIRDSLDWLEPEVHLDPAALKAEVARHAFERLAALQEFAPVESDRETITLVNHWDESDPRAPGYRLLMKTAEPFVTFSGSVRVGKEDRWLGLAVDHPPQSPGGRVQVRIDGRALGEFTVPPRPQWIEPAMQRVPVDEFRGRSVTVELVALPEKPESLWNWQAVSLLDRHPGLLPLFEDETQITEALRGGDDMATLITEKPYSGTAALRVTPPGVSNARLPGLEAAVREHPRLGEFRFIRFAWRKQGGQQVGLGLAHDGEFGADVGKRRPFIGRAENPNRPRRRPRRQIPVDERGYRHGFRYDAGQGEPASPALRLDGRAPDQWSLITRDLFGDFGHFTVTGLSLSCPDGEAAEFDHIWLARTQEDLNELAQRVAAASQPPQPPDPNIVRKAEDRLEFGEVLSTVAPQFTTEESQQGVWLLKEYRGRQNVVQTHPSAPGKPCILRAPLHIPAGKKARLELTVSHRENADWQLIVKADGQVLHDSLINKDTAKDGWADVTVDLSPLAGKKTRLEVHHHPNNWADEFAYWNRAAIVVNDQ